MTDEVLVYYEAMDEDRLNDVISITNAGVFMALCGIPMQIISVDAMKTGQ